MCVEYKMNWLNSLLTQAPLHYYCLGSWSRMFATQVRVEAIKTTSETCVACMFFLTLSSITSDYTHGILSIREKETCSESSCQHCCRCSHNYVALIG